MALWRDGEFVREPWLALNDSEPAPAGASVIVPLVRWRRDSQALAARGPVGVEIAAGKDALESLGEVASAPLVALRFEKFGDGRAFTYAILLRERHGFAGELRAVGDVLLDEIPLMLRCGFISFEIINEPTLRALREGRLPKFPLAYQPGHGVPEAHAGARPWLRRASGWAR